MSKFLKYIQINNMFIESEIDFTAVPKEANLKFCEDNKENLPGHIYAIILDVISNFYSKP